MARRVRQDDHRPDELLEEHGRIAYRLGLAVAWTSGIRAESAKKAADRGSGAWKGAAPLPDAEFAAGLFKTRCRTRNPVVAAVGSNAVLIEVDGDDALLGELGISLPATVTARSRRGLHRYYRPDVGCGPAKIQISADGVTLATDGYLCMPPSLHASGITYSYVSNGSIAPLGAETYELLAKLAGKTTSRIATAFEAGEKIPEGHRDNFVFYRALDLAHAGLSEAEILPSMLAVGRDRCEPPLDEAAVAKQVAGAVKRAQTKPSARKKVTVELERELATAISAAPEAAGVVAKPGVVAPRRTRVARRRVAEIDPRRQEWLLPGLVLIGAETLLAGVGGLGKSTLACQWISELTTGKLGPAGNAMIVSFEDAAEEVVRPRLQAAGADLTRVFVIHKEGGVIVLPDDLRELTRKAHETEAKLIVIDPVSASLSLKLDAHKDQDVRVVLAQLERVASERRLAVLLIAHLNKAPSADAYVRVSGSTGFYNACRSVVTVTPDPDDENCRLVAQHKSNYARLAPVQRHRVEQVVFEAGGEQIVTSKMVYVEDDEDVDPYQVLERHESTGPTKRARAATLLVSLLADGEWHERTSVESVATGQGVGRKTLERAATDLAIESMLHGFPATARWRLPVAPTPSSDEMSQLDETAWNKPNPPVATTCRY